MAPHRTHPRLPVPCRASARQRERALSARRRHAASGGLGESLVEPGTLSAVSSLLQVERDLPLPETDPVAIAQVFLEEQLAAAELALALLDRRSSKR